MMFSSVSVRVSSIIFGSSIVALLCYMRFSIAFDDPDDDDDDDDNMMMIVICCLIRV